MTDGTKEPIPPPLQQALLAIKPMTEVGLQQARIVELKAEYPRFAHHIDAWLYAESIYSPVERDQVEADERQIGPYTLLERIGQGGFGVVYVAEQKEPVRRRVAIKLVRVGRDSEAVLKRFLHERQILASLNHEAIAKVFDGGLTSTRRPYFVMEYVEGGKPITTYCDEQRLSIRERIALFQLVCQGVQHSHQKNILHRDLKPSNILVTKAGDRHVPKIIDFGIAKDTARMGGPGESVYTAQREMLGTPEYMSPEQAAGEPVLTTAIDVYSLGVVLYELLAGQLPFSSAWLRQKANDEVVRVLREEEPKKPSTKIGELVTAGESSSDGTTTQQAQRRRLRSPASWLHAVRGDLDWITMMALRKEPERRYPSPSQFAADLQRYLDHEPVEARKPSWGYRARKFVRRYRVQVVAAVLLLAAILGGSTGTYVMFARAEEKVHEFDQLKGVVLYERAIANEKDLYPAWPHKVEAMEAWLQADAGKLLAMKDDIEQTVRELEGRALAPTPEEMEADRRSHPRFAAFEVLGKRVASLRYAQAIREGKAQLMVPELTAEQQALDAQALNSLARPRVAIPATAGKAQEQPTIYGEEAFGLACARAAVAKAYGTDEEYQHLDTLAWALLANGHDAEAKAKSAEALGNAPDNEHEAYVACQRDLESSITKAAELLALAERELTELTNAVNERRTFRLELEAQQFLHDTLTELLGKLASLQAKECEVEARLLWAKQVQGLSLAHPKARHTWAAVRAAIAGNAQYVGQRIELRDQHITGLVPIGENPVTKLWEFYELRSAWDGKGDPREIAIPVHKPDGAIEVKGETGIVFVLLPGGTCSMGAQNRDPNGANFDPDAHNVESPVREVTLDPFFLARHELMRGQWQRLMATAPFWWKEGRTYGAEIAIGPVHPADSMDWEDANQCMERHGLVLPTEAQWEYGCRAGTRTGWWSGLEAKDLQGCANVHDQTSVQRQPQWGTPTRITDGFTGIAPVGWFRANGFGLFDVHGNVLEWCRDWYGDYKASVRAGDGYGLVVSSYGGRVGRGGSCGNPASASRSAGRIGYAPSSRHDFLGLRPARTLRP